MKGALITISIRLAIALAIGLLSVFATISPAQDNLPIHLSTRARALLSLTS
jgi:hypothetical protein